MDTSQPNHESIIMYLAQRRDGRIISAPTLMGLANIITNGKAKDWHRTSMWKNRTAHGTRFPRHRFLGWHIYDQATPGYAQLAA
jgi:hypothetical protein